jgi:hypothetical protein
VSGNDEYTHLTNFITDIFSQELSRHLQDNSFNTVSVNFDIFE